MERKDEILKYLTDKGNDKTVMEPLVTEFLFLENQLEELKKMPFIKVNPKNRFQQKSTPAAKLYKELLQQYTNVLKVLCSAVKDDAENEESPLRKWVKKHIN